jgi:hypothetical protein
MSDQSNPQPNPQEEAFASELRKAFIKPPDAAIRRAHLAKMAEIEPVAVVGPARRKRRRTAVRGRAFRGGLAAAGLVLVGGSALAATGSLPDAVQNAIADAVDPVVDLPGGHDSAAGGNPTNPIAAANKAEADAFTDAKKAYNACLKAEREAARDVESPDPSATPVESECGAKPQRQDFQTDKTPRPDRTPKVTPAERTPKPTNTHVPVKTERPERTEHPGATDHPTPPVDPGPPAD